MSSPLRGWTSEKENSFDDESPLTSPSLSYTSFSLSLDSLFSNHPIGSSFSPTLTSPEPQSYKKPAPVPSMLLEELYPITSSLSTPSPRNTTPPNHDRFYYPDGNITFLVGDVLYRMRREIIARNSRSFIQLLTPNEGGLSDAFPVSFRNVEPQEFDAFLSIIYPSRFDERDISSIEEWKAVLKLSTLWGFDSIRQLAIQSLDAITSPYDRLVLGRDYAVDRWVLPAMTALCERQASLTFEEALHMQLKDIIHIASVRDIVHTSPGSVNAAAILVHLLNPVRTGEAPATAVDTEVHCSVPSEAGQASEGGDAPIAESVDSGDRRLATLLTSAAGNHDSEAQAPQVAANWTTPIMPVVAPDPVDYASTISTGEARASDAEEADMWEVLLKKKREGKKGSACVCGAKKKKY